MKSLLIVFSLLSLHSQAKAFDCSYREVSELNKVYVVPVYKADVTYVFNKKDVKAYAQVRWGLDEVKTKECFMSGKEKFPSRKMTIPTVRIDNLGIGITGNDVPSDLEVMPLATGHWAGFTSIQIPNSARAEVIKAKESGEQMVFTNRDLNYRLTKVVRSTVGNIDCTMREEEAGVLNLFKRLGEVKQLVEARDSEEKINTEEVLQNFLGDCVEFKNVEANSLAEFDSKQRLNSKIIKGKLHITGNLKVEAVETMPSVSIENITVMDI